MPITFVYSIAWWSRYRQPFLKSTTFRSSQSWHNASSMFEYEQWNVCIYICMFTQNATWSWCKYTKHKQWYLFFHVPSTAITSLTKSNTKSNMILCWSRVEKLSLPLLQGVNFDLYPYLSQVTQQQNISTMSKSWRMFIKWRMGIYSC